jgi:hypothetical protein
MLRRHHQSHVPMLSRQPLDLAFLLSSLPPVIGERPAPPAEAD